MLASCIALSVIALEVSSAKSSATRRAPGSISWAERGIALGLFAEERNFDYAQMLREIRRTGANHVSVVVPYYQKTIDSTTIGEHPRLTPSYTVIRRTLRQARRLGLRVLLFPILRLEHASSPDEWRGTIRPSDRQKWWHSYQRTLLGLARLADQERASSFCVGSELESMDRDIGPWRPLIGAVRRVYRGRLVYSANWSNFERTNLWSLVDTVGISAYFSLVGAFQPSPSLKRLVHGWREARIRIGRFWAKVRRPILFTEVGYRSIAGSAAAPWIESSGHKLDLDGQKKAYQALFRVWNGAPYLRGAYLWNWFGFGGSTSREFTPRGKPAFEIVCEYYGGAARQCCRGLGVGLRKVVDWAGKEAGLSCANSPEGRARL